MATRNKPPSARSQRKQPPWLWIGLGAVVVVAGLIAVIASGGSDSETSAAGVEQTRDVEVSGTALAEFSDGTDPSEGQQIPEVRGASFDGTPVAIAPDGKAKVIVFVAHWCPHCQREIPVLAEYLESNPLPEGVDLITVATSTSPDQPNYPPSEWLTREGWPGPVLADSVDGAAGEAFGLASFPYFVAVDDTGAVVARTSGEIPTSEFNELVQRALGTGS